MPASSRGVAYSLLALLAAVSVLPGCQTVDIRGQDPGSEECLAGCLPLPTEKDKTTLPTYTIEPPDILKVCLAGDEAVAQPVAGEHIVAPDGTINLGPHGTVYVTGLTLEEGRAAVAAHLAQFIANPQVSLEVIAYNSKAYYIIVDRACFGETILRMACTGNETVLDAVAQAQGVCGLGTKRIWIARPAPDCTCDYQILPVNWHEITKVAGTATNYQILPGDRVYIADESWCAPLRHLFGAHPTMR